MWKQHTQNRTGRGEKTEEEARKQTPNGGLTVINLDVAQRTVTETWPARKRRYLSNICTATRNTIESPQPIES